ncbi:MAG: sodium-dependent transporter [Candidatus Zixiibacteriota bacterium]|nr:MAG: sodium-dependent transporter [candidate division Zixibacteria bacterium]
MKPDLSTETTGKTSRRLTWSTRFGFILAATGSAIGLGNIWKFPYITGVYGGGAFVLVYIGCVIVVGLPLMISELIIGRRGRQNPVGAFQVLSREGSPWQIPGWIGVAAGFVILSFYSVIAGHALAYIFKSLPGFVGTADQIREQYSSLKNSAGSSIAWHTMFMVLTIAIVAGGVRRGIERWARILMPTLFFLLLFLMIYGLAFTEGGAAAINFLFNPGFSALSAEGVLSALGHAFFTLSLGMGAMITYGSYMKKEVNIVRDAVTISFLDTFIALMAGLAIFSMVFAYGLEPGAGPGLLFETLPVLFAETGPWVAVSFFVLLTFAALTSAISLLEVVVSYFIDKRGWSRMNAAIIMGAVIYFLGLLSAIESIKVPFRGSPTGFFDIFDFVSTNYMLPLGGLLTGLFAAYVVKDRIRSEEFGSSGGLYRAFVVVLKFITPLAVLIVLLHGLELLPFMDYGN